MVECYPSNHYITGAIEDQLKIIPDEVNVPISPPCIISVIMRCYCRAKVYFSLHQIRVKV
jgi:hypothetical protein